MRPPFGIRADLKSIKRQFLDRPAVMSRFDKAALRRLAKFGGRTRTIARRSMRKGGRRKTVSQFDPELRKLLRQGRDERGRFVGFQDSNDIKPWPVTHSAPGKSPNALSRTLKDKIFFVANLDKRNVVIGPQVFDRSDVPGLLEDGGTAEDNAGKWVAFWENGVRKIRLAKNAGPRIKVKARPYMQPAYDKAVDALVPGIWQDSI